MLAHLLAEHRQDPVARLQSRPIRRARKVDGEPDECGGDTCVIVEQLPQLVSRIEAQDRSADRLDGQALQVLGHSHLAGGHPSPEVLLDGALEPGEVARDRFASERAEQDLLAPAVRFAVEQRDDVRIAAEERQYICRECSGALDQGRVEPLLGELRPGDEHGRLAEDVGAEDRPVSRPALANEAEYVLDEAQRLAEQRQAIAARRELLRFARVHHFPPPRRYPVDAPLARARAGCMENAKAHPTIGPGWERSWPIRCALCVSRTRATSTATRAPISSRRRSICAGGPRRPRRSAVACRWAGRSPRTTSSRRARAISAPPRR